MTSEVLDALPARRGHFLLESGYHSGVWLTLDELFVDSTTVAPLIAALAERIRPYGVDAVCGPLLGGAFLALSLAPQLGARFYCTEPVIRSHGEGELFAAEYRLPRTLQSSVRGQRVAVVDDVMSAGSSIRATVTALDAAGASPEVIGALLVLGEDGWNHFTRDGFSVETLERRSFEMWRPGECPLCRSGEPLEDPR